MRVVRQDKGPGVLERANAPVLGDRHREAPPAKPSGPQETSDAVLTRVHSLELAGNGAEAVKVLQDAISRCVHPVHILIQCRNDLQRRLQTLAALDTGAVRRAIGGGVQPAQDSERFAVDSSEGSNMASTPLKMAPLHSGCGAGLSTCISAQTETPCTADSAECSGIHPLKPVLRFLDHPGLTPASTSTFGQAHAADATTRERPALEHSPDDSTPCSKLFPSAAPVPMAAADDDLREPSKGDAERGKEPASGCDARRRGGTARPARKCEAAGPVTTACEPVLQGHASSRVRFSLPPPGGMPSPESEAPWREESDELDHCDDEDRIVCARLSMDAGATPKHTRQSLVGFPADPVAVAIPSGPPPAQASHSEAFPPAAAAAVNRRLSMDAGATPKHSRRSLVTFSQLRPSAGAPPALPPVPDAPDSSAESAPLAADAASTPASARRALVSFDADASTPVGSSAMMLSSDGPTSSSGGQVATWRDARLSIDAGATPKHSRQSLVAFGAAVLCTSTYEELGSDESACSSEDAAASGSAGAGGNCSPRAALRGADAGHTPKHSRRSTVCFSERVETVPADAGGAGSPQGGDREAEGDGVAPCNSLHAGCTPRLVQSGAAPRGDRVPTHDDSSRVVAALDFGTAGAVRRGPGGAIPVFGSTGMGTRLPLTPLSADPCSSDASGSVSLGEVPSRGRARAALPQLLTPESLQGASSMDLGSASAADSASVSIGSAVRGSPARSPAAFRFRPSLSVSDASTPSLGTSRAHTTPPSAHSSVTSRRPGALRCPPRGALQGASPPRRGGADGRPGSIRLPPAEVTPICDDVEASEDHSSADAGATGAENAREAEFDGAVWGELEDEGERAGGDRRASECDSADLLLDDSADEAGEEEEEENDENRSVLAEGCAQVMGVLLEGAPEWSARGLGSVDGGAALGADGWHRSSVGLGAEVDGRGSAAPRRTAFLELRQLVDSNVAQEVSPEGDELAPGKSSKASAALELTLAETEGWAAECDEFQSSLSSDEDSDDHTVEAEDQDEESLLLPTEKTPVATAARAALLPTSHRAHASSAVAKSVPATTVAALTPVQAQLADGCGVDTAEGMLTRSDGGTPDLLKDEFTPPACEAAPTSCLEGAFAAETGADCATPQRFRESAILALPTRKSLGPPARVPLTADSGEICATPIPGTPGGRARELQALLGDPASAAASRMVASWGLQETLRPVKAPPKQRAELGSDLVLTPVRRSMRRSSSGQTTATIQDQLQETKWAYMPNKAL